MIILYDVNPGDKLLIKDGPQVECIENMNDGQWLEVAGADGSELLHSQDILEVLKN